MKNKKMKGGVNMTVYNKESTKIKRRVLKKNTTPEEKMLWSVIKLDALGVRFRRQFGIGEYIVDFYCSKLKLGIELDGKQHDSQDGLEYDKIRDDYMRNLGIVTVRFKNKEIRDNLAGVIEKIKEYI
ncbi:endonuclease domain-containing protein [Psychrilyobacter atlanticus]|uniref:endonuclease domain-containing protein n=1 Tax=Psychrilyobacter atlanticus TaxID=271091 RepID=UPI0012EB5C01|nr:endonuclease domain-containing protein [Psychrilyobacter atlanticus]